MVIVSASFGGDLKDCGWPMVVEMVRSVWDGRVRRRHYAGGREPHPLTNASGGVAGVGASWLTPVLGGV
jgi:hypothetical protein